MECRIRDFNLHYEEAGTGRVLLILHGWSSNGRSLMPDFEPLFANRPGWRRIYPDMPGHGQSPIPNWLENHDVLLDMLLEFVDQVAPGERLFLAGNSWGGYLARGIVHHRPRQVDGVMLLVPVTEKEYDKRITPDHQALRHDADFDAALLPDEESLKEMLIVQTRTQLDYIRTTYTDPDVPQDPAILPLYTKNFSFNADALPEPCPAPMLLIAGRQDHVVGYQQAWPILDNFPRGTLAVLDRAGHFLSAEQPVLFRALTSEWLDRVEEYISQKAP